MAQEEGEQTRGVELTAQEQADWEYYVAWYRKNGWSGSDAEKNAWQDLRRKYPRLKRMQKP